MKGAFLKKGDLVLVHKVLLEDIKKDQEEKIKNKKMKKKRGHISQVDMVANNYFPLPFVIHDIKIRKIIRDQRDTQELCTLFVVFQI